jgi:hypothetical protein
MIKLRFVACDDTPSKVIILRAGVCMPFSPSHVECVTPEGKYAGQHLKGGMQARDPGYDKSILAHEAFVELPSTPAQADAFYAFVKSKLGQPYDWKAITDYVIPVNMHDFDHAICSATMVLGLRKCGWLKWPLTVPAHLISPRDLLLMLSGIIEIPH